MDEITCCLTPIDYPTPGVPSFCPECHSILAVREEDFALLAHLQTNPCGQNLPA